MDELVTQGDGGIPRRAIFRGLGMGIGLLGIGGVSALLSGCSGEDGSDDDDGDLSSLEVDVLNFALNLEYLEAEFYTFATTGAGIEALGIAVEGRGDEGATTGYPNPGNALNFSDPLLGQIANEIARDEREHVEFLRRRLGSRAVGKPAIDLNAFAAGANGFAPFASEANFLRAARALEDLGQSVYLGIFPDLRGDRDVLEDGGRLLAVEAQHAGNLRLAAAMGGIPAYALDDRDVDVFRAPGNGQFFTTSGNDDALAIRRTARQTLDIVYGATGAEEGGFFPNGINFDS